jgi:hypothetical protein
MADDNDNIFAPRASGPESNVGNGERSNAADGERIAGRIDPAIARASSGEGIETKLGEPASPESGPASEPTGPAEPARRGRGRPRKDGTTGPASPAGTKEKTHRIRAGVVEKVLGIMHLAAAGLLSAPELKLDADDAKLLGEAWAEVLALHNIELTDAQKAYAGLIEACAMVYPPMVGSIILRKQAEAKARRPSATVTPIRPQAAPPPPTAPGTFDPANIHIPDGA